MLLLSHVPIAIRHAQVGSKLTFKTRSRPNIERQARINLGIPFNALIHGARKLSAGPSGMPLTRHDVSYPKRLEYSNYV